MWYNRRESEKRGKVIYATCYCRLNVFLAWCFKRKKLKYKEYLKNMLPLLQRILIQEISKNLYFISKIEVYWQYHHTIIVVVEWLSACLQKKYLGLP